MQCGTLRHRLMCNTNVDYAGVRRFDLVKVMVINFDHQYGVCFGHQQYADGVDLEKYSGQKIM